MINVLTAINGTGTGSWLAFGVSDLLGLLLPAAVSEGTVPCAHGVSCATRQQPDGFDREGKEQLKTYSV